MFYKYTYIIVLALLTSFLFSACSSKKKPKPKPPIEISDDSSINQKALIVGVSDYAGEGNDLSGINLDVSRMQTLITNWGFDVDTLSNSMSFEQKLNDYANTLNSDDVFILYYSGHGSFTPDSSGDELDGRDEMIVLSDSDNNLYMIDDKINLLLNQIKARKLIIFDSCNSGTSIKRTIRDKTFDVQVKFISAPKSIRDINKNGESIPNTSISGTYLYYAACRDDEQSLASGNGSLFTNAFIANVNLNQSASFTHQKTEEILKNHFHPLLSASDENLKNSTLKTYLKIR